ncbi:MAG TPA: hypothetical protein VF559_07185 [Caulobacteraceae bacterium]|jgi:hypothetical protein
MLRHAILAATVALSGPAFASGKAEKSGAAPTLLMSPLPLPVVSEGRLVNYVYVNLRLTLSPGADAEKLREKEPYFRDALVRAAHRTRLAPPGDNNKVDEAKLRAVILAESVRIAGRGAVTGVQVLRAQPQRQVRNP